jgi:hypothetical protein
MCNSIIVKFTAQVDSSKIYFQKAIELSNENNHAEAFQNFTNAKRLFIAKKAFDSVAICDLRIFKLLDAQNDLDYDPITYLDSYYQYALNEKDTLKLIISNYNYASYYFNTNPVVAAKYYHKTLYLGKQIKRKRTLTSVYANLALLYTETAPDSASYFFKKTLSLLTVDTPNQLISTHINYANFFQKKGRYNEALAELKKAEKLTPNRYKLKLDKVMFLKFSECYQGIGDYKKAYLYSKKYNAVKDSINNTTQNIAIADLDKKYKTAEKEKELLKEQQKSEERRNLLIAALLFILSGSFIAYLMLKNSRKKQQLAEQEKSLEVQKNLTLLKEQEITTINAIVDGQEKERKRIAEDLHDNLGSVLATLKLHFENLKINQKTKKINQEVLFDKTENLIDEAYLKVRSIAHAKNAGVIANKGLLMAVQMMAEKISSANKISIEVVHYGLDQTIENSLEISIFRIIQELTTNILKHAAASQATINISQHEYMLNLIIEDNGSGFDQHKVTYNEGMGLTSIKKRIEYLKGEFIIDSTLKKGTTIIINIPLKSEL